MIIVQLYYKLDGSQSAPQAILYNQQNTIRNGLQ